MREQAPEIDDWLEDAAVLGIVEVLKKYRYFRRKMDETIESILDSDPELVIPIDYPGFNLRLAKSLRKRGYRGKIAYYISPQVWAWKRGRIKEMAKTLDLMICIFPFEKPLYENSGLKTEFAGHPLIDELAPKRIDRGREEKLIGLFPGSRSREIEALFPAMIEAAVALRRNDPDTKFVTNAANEKLGKRLQQIIDEGDLEIEVRVGDHFHELLQTVTCAVIASGTATLEAAYFRTPYCLVYKVAPFTALIARWVMKVDYLGIVNNLANREVVPELLQEDCTGSKIANQLDTFLREPETRAKLAEELGDVVAMLGDGGAHDQAADVIAELLA